jgi:hypothetical protein
LGIAYDAQTTKMSPKAKISNGDMLDGLIAIALIAVIVFAVKPLDALDLGFSRSIGLKATRALCIC